MQRRSGCNAAARLARDSGARSRSRAQSTTTTTPVGSLSYPGGIIPEFFWNRHFTKILYANTGVGGVKT